MPGEFYWNAGGLRRATKKGLQAANRFVVLFELWAKPANNWPFAGPLSWPITVRSRLFGTPSTGLVFGQ
jgi:hypothetical protein